MILAIDIGNSNIVVGCFDRDDIIFVERISTNRDKNALEYVTVFKDMLEIYRIDVKNIDGGIISSVVPSLTQSIKEAVNKLTGLNVLIVGPEIKTGLNILMDNPSKVGSDLIVDAVAGISKYNLPLIIFDMGTATTVSVIDENKNYIGSMIIPGIGISLNSLISRVSQLPQITLEAPKHILGKNTIDSMNSGIVYSTAASIDGIVSRIENELGKKATVVVTGGLAGSIIPFCESSIILDDELLLRGLMIIYNKNL